MSERRIRPERIVWRVDSKGNLHAMKPYVIMSTPTETRRMPFYRYAHDNREDKFVDITLPKVSILNSFTLEPTLHFRERREEISEREKRREQLLLVYLKMRLRGLLQGRAI